MTTDPAELQRQLDEINRQFPGVEASVFEVDPDDMVARIAENDAAVFLPPIEFGFHDENEFGPERLACVTTECDWLEELIRRGGVTCGRFGIGTQMGTDPEHLVDVEPYVHFALNVCPLYVWLSEAPDDWMQAAMRRVRVLFPDRGAGLRMHLTTGPMETYTDGPRWFPSKGDAGAGLKVKPGRNDPCWCGSGLKHKRCHGS